MSLNFPLQLNHPAQRLPQMRPPRRDNIIQHHQQILKLSCKTFLELLSFHCSCSGGGGGEYYYKYYNDKYYDDNDQ